MNKSLELNFWPTLYDMFTDTGNVSNYLKLNKI